MSILFEDVVFGPIRSRRLGSSLGINLLPLTHKICNFDCVYCECGWTDNVAEINFEYPSKSLVIEALNTKLNKLSELQENVDSITFSGNGEPTLHPEFPEIIDAVISSRDKFYPKAKITVITNATNLSNPSVFEALQKVDNPLLKLDAGNIKLFERMNRASDNLNFEEIVANLIRFNGRGIIQTMLIRSHKPGEEFDNTTDAEISSYLDILRRIKPRSVMLYVLDREAPASGLEKLRPAEVEQVAGKVRDLGFEVNCFC